jgi:hypothetical protein
MDASLPPFRRIYLFRECHVRITRERELLIAKCGFLAVNAALYALPDEASRFSVVELNLKQRRGGSGSSCILNLKWRLAISPKALTTPSRPVRRKSSMRPLQVANQSNAAVHRLGQHAIYA